MSIISECACGGSRKLQDRAGGTWWCSGCRTWSKGNGEIIARSIPVVEYRGNVVGGALLRAHWGLRDWEEISGQTWRDLSESHRIAWQAVEDELVQSEGVISKRALIELASEYLERIENLLNVYLKKNATKRIKIATIR